MKKLRIGDIVRLNSGGPLMTVTETTSDRSDTHVAWFTESGHDTTCGLDERCLVFVERPPHTGK